MPNMKTMVAGLGVLFAISSASAWSDDDGLATSTFELPTMVQEANPTGDSQKDVSAFNATYRSLQEAIGEGRFRDAIAAGEEAFELSKKLDGVSNHETALLALVLGRLNNTLFQYDKALAWFESSVNYMTLAHGYHSKDHYRVYSEITKFGLHRNDYDLTRKYLSELDTVVRNHFNYPCTERGQAMLLRGDMYRLRFRQKTLSRKTLKDMERRYRLAKSDFEAVGDHEGIGDAEFRLGRLELEARRNFAASRHFERAVKAYLRANVPTGSEVLIRTRTFLSIAYSRQGKEDLATEQLVLISKHHVETENTNVQPVYRTNPKYPRYAADRGIEGWVHMEFIVTIQGKIEDIKVLDSDPRDVFDQAAMDAVAQWRYIPGRFEGKLAAFKTEVVVTFEFQ